MHADDLDDLDGAVRQQMMRSVSDYGPTPTSGIAVRIQGQQRSLLL